MRTTISVEAAAEGVPGAPGQTSPLARFELLAGAICGRRVGVTAHDGPRSFTDGESIFISAELAAELVATTVIVQASLLAAGTLEPRAMIGLAGRPSVRDRYLTLEAVRATSERPHIVPATVHRRLSELYSGTIPASPAASLRLAGAARSPVPAAPDWLGTIKPVRVLRSSPGGAAAAPSARDLEAGSVEVEIREMEDDEAAERSRVLELLSAPLTNPFASMVQRFFDMSRTPAGGAGGAELPVGGRSRAPVGPNAAPARWSAPFDRGFASGGLGRVYPEWDHRRGVYRADHCFVAEFDPPDARSEDAWSDVGDRRLRGELGRLGLSLERHRRQLDGDSLDVTAMVEHSVARRAGHGGDGRIYELGRRTGRDLGVLVLLDATGSTGESVETGSVFGEQRRLAGRLIAAFDELGDRVAGYGFYSRGREAVRFLRIKDFDDPFDHRARRRLARLAPGGYTRLGAAVRHASAILRARAGTARLLLVVVGDGLPYEDGYEHLYAEADSRRALEEAMADGVGCACVSVRSSVEAAVVERVWGSTPHRRLIDAAELSRQARPLFGEALGLAAASRRRTGMEARTA